MKIIQLDPLRSDVYVRRCGLISVFSLDLLKKLRIANVVASELQSPHVAVSNRLQSFRCTMQRLCKWIYCDLVSRYKDVDLFWYYRW